MDYREEWVNDERSVIEVDRGMIFYLQDNRQNKNGEFNKHFYLALAEPNPNGFVPCFTITSARNMSEKDYRYIPFTMLKDQKSYVDLNEIHSMPKGAFINRNYRAIVKNFDLLPREDFIKFIINMFLHINGLPSIIDGYILDMLYTEYIEAYNQKYAGILDRADPDILVSSRNQESNPLTYRPFQNLYIDDEMGDDKNENEVEITEEKSPNSRLNSWNIKKWSNSQILQYLDLKEQKTTEELMEIFGYKKSTIYSMSYQISKEARERKLLKK